MSTIDELRVSVINGKKEIAVQHVNKALEEGIGAAEILNTGLIGAMEKVGSRFEKGLLYLPEMLMASIAMKACTALLEPHLKMKVNEVKGRFLIGSAKGDLHDIGKNLVASMVEGSGMEVVDLGIDVAPMTFFEEAMRVKADVVGISSLLTTTMPSMRETIRVFEEKGARGSVKIVIGGAPVSEDFANEISADGYAPDAAAAVRLVKGLF